MPSAKFQIWRGDSHQSGKLQEYPVEFQEGMVVLDVVHKIQAEQQPDLACRWNCKAGKCGSCSAEINGKPRLMCMTRLSQVNLHEPVPLLDDGPGANPIVRAVRRAWQNFVGFIAGFIEMLGVLIPLGAIIAALVWGIRRVWRARKRPS